MPHKQTRKIIRIGNSLAVTIPKAWLSYFGLSEKDQVTVLSNGALIIKPITENEQSHELSKVECPNIANGKRPEIA